MNCNPHMPFSEQDYHLLKTHQSSGGNVKQELLESISQISFDNQHNYMFDIVFDAYLNSGANSFNFSSSPGCSVTKKTDPTNIGSVGRMTISIATNNEAGTNGQIFCNGGIYNITCASGSSWTITLPTDNYYFYNGVKTEVGKPGEVI